ncbi:MAG: DUF2330 domain-containing protein, partial [Planctomycetota bacterium]|nr:DUF2330 domain-containing protein [Planctomycetota bacterium]
REGWKFVAARLERPGAEATGPLGSRPLAFTFPTEKAVYPLRLTGTGGEPCSVELYVFGPRRATIAGFESVLCQRPGYPGGVGDGGPSPGEAGSSDGSGAALPVLHPELSKVVRGARVATKLTARLGPEDMQNDAYVEWRDYQPSWPTRYSSWGAYMLAANVALNLLFVSFLVLLAVTRGKRLEGRRAQWWVGGVVVACSLAGAVVWSSLPKADVPDAHEFEPYVLHRQVADFLRAGVRRSTLDLARVGGFIERMFAGDVGPQANPYTGGSIRYEDSPGNYTLRATRQEIVYTWYDRAGAAHPERITR